MADVLLVLNLIATFTMVGVIWFVQIVHYPLLSVVPVQSASVVAADHQRRTGWVVMAPMTIQGFTMLGLLRWVPAGAWWPLPWLNGFFLAIALGGTIFLSVPRHERMAHRPDATVGKELVDTNWPRTIAWSACGCVAVVMLLQRLAQ